MTNWDYDEELKTEFYPFQPMTGDPELQGLVSALAGAEVVREQFLVTRRDYEDMCCGGASVSELFGQIKNFVDEFLGASKEAGVSLPSGITEERVRRCLEASILHWYFSVYESGGPPRKKAKTQQ
jgi:hypothetical protein